MPELNRAPWPAEPLHVSPRRGAWASVAADRPPLAWREPWWGRRSFKTRLCSFSGAILLHALFVAGAFFLHVKRERHLVDETQNAVRVRMVRGAPDAAPSAPAPAAEPALEGGGQNPSRIPAPLTSLAPRSDARPVIAAQVPSAVPDSSTSPIPQSPPVKDEPLNFSPGLKTLLPQASPKLLDAQRNYGLTMGRGAVAGDVAETRGDAPDISEGVEKPRIIVREYPFASFMEAFNQRFAEAWGGTRQLPRDAHFQGIVGEYIEYDLLIGRDGSLKQVINVSARKQPERDFTAVDDAFLEVVDSVLPYPVPERLLVDPLIIRKRIMYTGFLYQLF